MPAAPDPAARACGSVMSLVLSYTRHWNCGRPGNSHRHRPSSLRLPAAGEETEARSRSGDRSDPHGHRPAQACLAPPATWDAPDTSPDKISASMFTQARGVHSNPLRSRERRFESYWGRHL